MVMLTAMSVACQAPSKGAGAVAAAARANLMEQWKVYDHCRTSDNTESVLLDALVLHRSIQEERYPELPALLRPIRRWMDPMPVRLAVDPKAMAAACTLRAADMALEHGWTDIAMQVYRGMIAAYTAPQYAYYVEQARTGLTDAVQRTETVPSSHAALPE